MKRKFQDIYKQLSESIEAGTFQTGTTLPSENELAENYNASRETIRKALNMLSEHGYIQKVQGKGSIVLDMSRINFPFSGVISFQELSQKLGTRTKTEVVYLKKEHATDHQLKGEERVWRVHRVRHIDGERIILDKDVFSVQAVPHLTNEICENSIYDFIENNLGLTISFAHKEIVIEEPSEEDQHLLDLNGSHNIVVIRSFTYLEDATLFQYTESRHRPDKFRFVDFARRVQT
ncbi:GntR family trehalose operon transcriptional repressor [Geomicrobium halophilum]|uniref:Trehalose operon repressor n=1 Tax=Geomicrobium halophilum TaxID=549000 RepID=A0A841PSD7_9BACL|nr:trehalose operon repressor [Geomicrobium halophilum]MBB6450096.1 GntR family trehalose operon transcriptional repressor [Geomicrobium halophilum]